MNSDVRSVVKEKKSPTAAFSLLAIGTLAILIGIGVGVLKMLLFFGWLLLAPFGAKLGYSFSEMLEKA